jgi:hypothetical protein
MRIVLFELKRMIAEVLKRSDAERVAQELVNAAGKVNGRVSSSVDDSGKMLNVFIRHLTGDPDAIEPALLDAADKLGWSLLSKSDRRGIVWWFEPKAETKGHVKKLPDSLFHVTLSANVEKIMRDGLVPRTRQFAGTSRRYPSRIYLATSAAGARATINREDDWRLLQIDRRLLPKGQKFYLDQEFGYGKDDMPRAVYTLDPIPASAIFKA